MRAEVAGVMLAWETGRRSSHRAAIGSLDDIAGTAGTNITTHPT